jgi:hypothetical protein
VVVHKALRPLPSRVEKCYEAALCPGFGGAAARGGGDGGSGQVGNR